MKLSCLQENLARGLGVVGRAVATRSTLPITQNVMLTSDQGMLRLSATNLEIAITTWIGAMIAEEGTITVPHRLVTDLVNSLPSDRVDLDLRGPDSDDPDAGGGSVLHISCGRSRTHINGAAADDFPPIPQVDSAFATNIAPFSPASSSNSRNPTSSWPPPTVSVSPFTLANCPNPSPRP